MKLVPIDTYDDLSPEVFRKEYFNKKRPVVLKNLSHNWPAYHKWNWDFIKSKVGHCTVGVYNNVKSDAYTPINTDDGKMNFGDYIDTLQKGPVELRVFLFNIFEHAPELIQDFDVPNHYLKNILTRFPMLFTGGKNSVTHLHFDIDMSHIMHTQYLGKKRVLLFDYNQKDKLYRLPYAVLSMVNFHDVANGNIDYDRFPALKLIYGYDLTLEHGDTLFMPSGYWHHIEYLEPGLAMSLRALDPSLSVKLKGVYNLFVMRSIDTLLKKAIPVQWGKYKENKAIENGQRQLLMANGR